MVTINPESAIPDQALSSSFPYILRIQPIEKSFYTALGYSVIYRLLCVKTNMRKQLYFQIKEYLRFELRKPNIDADLIVDPQMQSDSNSFIEFLDNILQPNTSVQEAEMWLKERASMICNSFQIILAAIFAKSNKIVDAQDILNGNKVLFQSSMYFNNFAKSLCIRLAIKATGEDDIVSIDEQIADRVNVELYVTSKHTSEFAILRHQKEIDFMVSGDATLVNDMPFVFIRKKNFAPILNNSAPPPAPVPNMNIGMPQGAHGLSSGVPALPAVNSGLPSYLPGMNSNVPGLPNLNPGLPPSLPGVNSHAPGLPNMNPGLPPSLPVLASNVPGLPYTNPNPLPNNSSDSPVKKSSQSTSNDPEKALIDTLLPILMENSIQLTREESKTLKKLLRNLKSQNKSLITEEFRNFRDATSEFCQKNHDPANFVIFKSCNKRHCKLCMSSTDSKIICNCKREVTSEDMSFLLGMSIKCIICGNVIENPTQKIGQGHYIHRECASRLSY